MLEIFAVSSELLAWLGFGATLVFGFLSIYLFLKSRRYKQLICTYSRTTLQTKAHPEVEILFRGEPVANLTKLLALIWNGGTEEIRTSDLGSLPQILLPPHSRVLSVATLESATSHTRFEAEKASDTSVRASFAYLNPDEGGLVEVLFEAPAAVPEPAFDAPVIGGRSPFIQRYVKKQSRVGLALKLGMLLMILAFSVYVGGDALHFHGRLVILALIGPSLMFIGASILAFGMLDGNYREWIVRRVPEFAKTYFEKAAS